MSSYLNIYVRKANTETCISLVSYSRSNRIYETFDQVFGNNIESWDNPKCQSLTIGDLNAWTDHIEAEIKRNKDGIKYYQDLQQYIKTTSAPLDEIMERYHEYQEMIDYHKEELEDLIKTSHWVYFLKQIHNEQQMLEKDWPGTLWIYAGIEGSNPYPDNKEAK